MKRSILALAVAAAVVLAAGPAAAQKGGPKAPKVKTTQPSPKAGSGGPKVQTSAQSHGPKTATQSHGPKTTTQSHGPKTTQPTQTTTKTHGRPAAEATSTTATTSATTTKTTTSATTLSPVQLKLQKNKNLFTMLEGRLPKGTDVIAAAERFRNLGQFVAAVNVSNNLQIPFTELRARMLDEGMSLGQAIKAERNDVDATIEVQRAEREARIIIADTEKSTTETKAPKTKKRDGGR